MKKRTFHYVFDNKVELAEEKETGSVSHSFSFKYQSFDIESEDLFEDDLLLVALDINHLHNIDSILRTFGYREDAFYFYNQCKEVISFPEKHTDDKGKGKLDFQSFFHNIPYSVCSINDTAIVVLAFHPLGNLTTKGQKDYNLVGYIHANRFEFKPEGEKLNGYYYNMLRITDQPVKGERIYRRKRIFTMFFSVLHKITFVNNVDYAYASMGRENQAINGALHRSATVNDLHYERHPFKVYAKVNKLFGKKSYSKELVNITHDTAALKEMYKRVNDKMGNYLFYHMYDESIFFDFIAKLTEYSKTSGVYMLKDSNGNMEAATIAINWGDYFSFLMQNPKGLFAFIDSLKITEKILYPILSIGEPKAFKKLVKGLAYHYKKQHNVDLCLLPSYEGDPLESVKKSLVVDEYIYFIITHNKNKLEHFKNLAKDSNNNPRLFVDQPII